MFSSLKELYRSLRAQLGGEEPALVHAQLTMLDEVGRALASAMEGLEPTLELICEAVVAILGVERAMVFFLDPAQAQLRLQAARGMVDSAQALDVLLSAETGVLARCLQGTGPLLVEVERGLSTADAQPLRELDLHHFLAAPLRHGGQARGVLVADTRRDHEAFSAADRQLISVLANLAAVARENASLISQLKTRTHRLNALLEISSALSSTLELEPLLSLILDHAMGLTRASSGAILLTEEGATGLVVQCARGPGAERIYHLALEPGQGITGHAVASGESLRVPDVRRDPRYVVAHEQVLSELAIPIRQGSQVLGVINVDSDRLDAFSELDQQLLEVLAAHAAVALRNASLFDALRHRVKE